MFLLQDREFTGKKTNPVICCVFLSALIVGTALVSFLSKREENRDNGPVYSLFVICHYPLSVSVNIYK